MLLGDEVELLTIFGGGVFGPVIEKACRDIGIGTAHCEMADEDTHSFFVAVNNADGELVGGIADMDAVEGMDAAWIAARLAVINAADAVVADSNLMPGMSMGILQARILECVAMPSSRGSSQPRDRTQVSCIAGGFFTS